MKDNGEKSFLNAGRSFYGCRSFLSGILGKGKGKRRLSVPVL